MHTQEHASAGSMCPPRCKTSSSSHSCCTTTACSSGVSYKESSSNLIYRDLLLDML